MKLILQLSLCFCLLEGCTPAPPSEKQMSMDVKAIIISQRDSSLTGFEVFGAWRYNKARTMVGHPVRLFTRAGGSDVINLEYRLTADSGWQCVGYTQEVND
jgi:hypothetical protein